MLGKDEARRTARRVPRFGGMRSPSVVHGRKMVAERDRAEDGHPAAGRGRLGEVHELA